MKRGPVLTACLAAGLLSLPLAADAGTNYRPQPDTYMGSARPGISAMSTAWGCHGHANTPSTAYSVAKPPMTRKKGISYSAFQDCWGDVEAQRVCVQLWYLDYYSEGHPISTMSCGPWGTVGHSFRGRFLTCSAIGKGHVRYYARSNTYAVVDGVTKRGSGQSYSKTLC